MNEQINELEKHLIYLLAMEDIADIKKIYNIESKFLTKEMKNFIKDYKISKNQGYSILEVLNKYRLEEIITSNNYNMLSINVIKDLKRQYIDKKMIECRNSVDDIFILDTMNEVKSILLNEDLQTFERLELGNIEDSFFDELGTVDTALKLNFKTMNEIVRMTPQNMNIICARPGVGKTAFALALVLGLVDNHKGILFNLEMGTKEVLKRLVTQISKIPLRALNSPNKFQALGLNEKERVKEALKELKNKKDNLEIMTGSFTLDQIREQSKYKKENGGLEYIVVDYMQLITERTGKTRYEQVTNISLGLKAIARDLNIVVIALAQLSRDSEKRSDKRPMLSDLRDSGQIEQDASIVIGLHSELIESSHTSKALLEAIILKNRMDRRGTIKFDYYLEKQLIFEV